MLQSVESNPGDTVFLRVKGFIESQSLEDYFSEELQEFAEQDAYVFPYVVNLLSRMALQVPSHLDDETPVSVKFVTLSNEMREGVEAGVLSERFRSLADELFFSCAWTPERFENPRRPVDIDFYIGFGAYCYTNAAELSERLKKEDRAKTMFLLADDYADWLDCVNNIKSRVEGEAESIDSLEILANPFHGKNIRHCIEYFDTVAAASGLPGPKAIADQYRGLMGVRVLDD